jgi:hypothetical protein
MSDTQWLASILTFQHSNIITHCPLLSWNIVSDTCLSVNCVAIPIICFLFLSILISLFFLPRPLIYLFIFIYLAFHFFVPFSFCVCFLHLSLSSHLLCFISSFSFTYFSLNFLFILSLFLPTFLCLSVSVSHYFFVLTLYPLILTFYILLIFSVCGYVWFFPSEVLYVFAEVMPVAFRTECLSHHPLTRHRTARVSDTSGSHISCCRLFVMPNCSCPSDLEISVHFRYDGADVMYRQYWLSQPKNTHVMLVVATEVLVRGGGGCPLPIGRSEIMNVTLEPSTRVPITVFPWIF